MEGKFMGHLRSEKTLSVFRVKTIKSPMEIAIESEMRRSAKEPK